MTFCHVAGRAEDPANTVTLTLPYNAVFGQAGHFNEDGTPQAGHEQDHLGACQTPPTPTDVCPNIDGNQAEIPDGLAKDEQGNCVTPPPPPTGVKHLVVTKTAGTSWYKVYNWDVEKSVDKSQLDLKQGATGSVVWKVDVTQTGWTAAEHRRGRHDHRREPERHGGDWRGSHGPASRHDCLLWCEQHY